MFLKTGGSRLDQLERNLEKLDRELRQALAGIANLEEASRLIIEYEDLTGNRAKFYASTDRFSSAAIYGSLPFDRFVRHMESIKAAKYDNCKKQNKCKE
jgi:hypothetical protein